MNVIYYLQWQKGLEKLVFYLTNFSAYMVPRAFFRWRRRRLLASLSLRERQGVERRVAYYNRVSGFRVSADWPDVGHYAYPFGQKERHTNYFFDLYRVVRYFPDRLRFFYLFGDVTTVPAVPSFVKSRPLTPDNENAVLLKLNAVRHFRFVSDRKTFREKQDRMVSRNVVRQPWRRLLLERFFQHPLCDLGQVNTDTAQEHPEWVKPYMTMAEQLDYKFVACIEGNDVATNLKWVMSSNSVAVMPRPRFETWFMEGTLVPGYHYVEVRPDYADLEERLRYYMDHPEAAEAIIANAHRFVAQFCNRRIERAVQIRVAEEYFRRSGQLWKR